MKIVSCFVKTFKENLRDWKILVTVFAIAPFFVYMMYFYLLAPGASAHTVLVLNEDKGDYSKGLIDAWEKLATEDGKPMLAVRPVYTQDEARDLVKGKAGDVWVTIPAGFSDTLESRIETGNGPKAELVNYGYAGNVKYVTAASLVDYAASGYVDSLASVSSPLAISYVSAGTVRDQGEFDLYVPALLVLAIIMILFTTGASIVREVEKGTIARLTLSRLTSVEFMVALGANQVVIGISCLLLALLAGVSVGYRSDGSVFLVALVGSATSFAVVGIGIITSCFIKNMFGLLTLGCFPMFAMMFFSDCFIPMPRIVLLEIAGNTLFLNDFLPTATATRALQKVLVYGSGIGDIAFELVWILVLSSLLFAIGIILFKKKYGY